MVVAAQGVPALTDAAVTARRSKHQLRPESCRRPRWRRVRTCGPKTPNRPPRGPVPVQSVEATIGVEPMNKGFADPRVRPLRHVAAPSATERIPDGSEPRRASRTSAGAASPARARPSGRGIARELAAPRGFEPRLTDPKSAVLPLDEGAVRHDLGYGMEGNGAEDGTRTRDPHLGKVMLYQLSHFRSICRPSVGAESQIRTGDTAIFSRVLYQLSYLGPYAGFPQEPRRRGAG